MKTKELLPSELFQRQVYITYWFEHAAPTYLVDALPIDNVLFETDFPHTACLYGNIQETIERGLGRLHRNMYDASSCGRTLLACIGSPTLPLLGCRAGPPNTPPNSPCDGDV